MRPLDKYYVGQTVTMEDGTTVTIENKYTNYSEARPILLNNFGEYCSYCENSLHNGALLDTEHIRPKSIKPEYETDWDNFLISCRVCNGPGGKWYNDVPNESMHLPHQNNTILSLQYDEAGVVRVNPNLAEESKLNAQALIDFLKLNKSPKEAIKDNDGRTNMRKRTWQLAQDALSIYKESPNLQMLMMLIKARGGWSIWYTVFKECPEVRKALIEMFPGTAKECFDHDNGYEPIACASHPV